MSGGLKLYIDFISPPCRSLYIALKQSGLPFEKVLIDLGKKQQTTSEYKKLNRFQKVPCIAEGDFKLSESVAILRYLASSNRAFDKLVGGGNKENLIRVEEYLQWQYTLRKEILNFFHLDWLSPLRTGIQTPIDEVQEAKRELERVLEILEKTWLSSSKFLIGNEMTVADIFGASELQQTILSKYDVGRKYPKISEWLETVREETNPHFDYAHTVLYKLANK
ncbi:glutathione S-transferase theta-3-like [Eupeodes corollae]|uniref:glutathione S-transferase theta-3-like n=1 Tax=Eupeodes corollae TaxID=290404 RepID=UPI0024900526|nr:glutathione S-transferase theta-3-like [Eupeodes corollae]